MRSPFAIGSEFGRYRIEALVGKGGMGEVYLAEHARLKRKVALKVLTPELSEDSSFRERFVRESQLAASLEHPSVVTVYEADEVDGLLFIAMRYVEGTDLRQLLRERGPLSVELTYSILAQVASALDAAHAHGLVHRDVKPANILLSLPPGAEPLAFLSDFGLTKRASSASGLTRTGQFMGSIDYMAPEQIRGDVVDGRADVYSLGCVLYECLTGAPPFAGREHDMAALWAHLQEPVPSVLLLRPDLPSELDDVIARATAKLPEDRFESCRLLTSSFVDFGVPEPSRSQPTRGGAVGARRRSNLPAEADPLIGRQHELAEIADLLERNDVRHLTLTGTGGTGKTRLAVAVGHRALEDGWSSGVFFVALAPVSSPADIPSTVASSLGITPSPSQPLWEAVKGFLTRKQMLLVLDNYEHLLDGASLVPELLAAAPEIKILATSRAPLHTTGEHDYPVSPLTVPDKSRWNDLEAVAGSEAVTLFVARARAAVSTFDVTTENAPAVAEICARLDGLPLALELAATRTKVLAPMELAKRLERRLDVLTSGKRDAPERQRTLRATLEWSHELLSPSEQELFAQLGVFAGGFSLEGAEAVGSGGSDALDGLATLVEYNLVHRDPGVGQDQRFLMLETIREYALERLGRDLAAEHAARRRHADHHVSLAERARPHLRSSQQGEWIEILSRESENIRAAMSFALEHAPTLANRLAGALAYYWEIRGDMGKVMHSLREVRDRLLANDLPVDPRITFMMTRLAMLQGEFDGAEQLLEGVIEEFRKRGDVGGEVSSLSQLAWAHESRGDLIGSRALDEQALAIARASADDWAIATALTNLADGLITTGEDLGRLRALTEEALEVRRRIGEPRGMIFTLSMLGLVALADRHAGRAVAILEEALELSRDIGFATRTATTLAYLGWAHLLNGHDGQALAAFVESTSIALDFRLRNQVPENLNGFAELAARRGKALVAARLVGAAEAGYEASSSAVYPHEKNSLAAVRRAGVDALGEDGFEAEVRHGRTMSLDEATSYALDALGAHSPATR